VAEDLLASLGMYGASLVVAFIAGLFPLFSIELFLMGLSAIVQPTLAEVVLCSVLAAVGHQVAKTITYYAGAGALEHGKIKVRVDKLRHKIEKWKNAPKLILLLSGAIGIPPLWIIGFIARPLLGIGIVPFTLIIFATRIGRFIVLAGAPLLF
jgi:membrane protein YqaA with SNARE-associated domain